MDLKAGCSVEFGIFVTNVTNTPNDNRKQWVLLVKGCEVALKNKRQVSVNSNFPFPDV